MAELQWTQGDLVRKLRDAFGLTMEQLATKAGVSTSAIYKLEKGITKQADQTTVRKLATAFSLSAGQFVDAVPKQTIVVDLPSESRKASAGKKGR